MAASIPRRPCTFGSNWITCGHRRQGLVPRSPSSRHASTAASTASSRLRNTLYGSTLAVLAAAAYVYITDARASIHQYITPPVIRMLYPDAEDSHHAGTRILKELWALGLYPRERSKADSDGLLGVEVFGQTLANPIGISGGLDKNAEIPDALLALGPAVVEIGGVTPLPQDGNPRPRVFRIESQNAIINRYGLNSDGADVVAMRLRQRLRDFAYHHGFGINEEAEKLVLDGAAGVPPGSLVPGRLLAVQIAKNKLTPESDLDAVVRDHVYCVQRIGKYADIIVVNVSSPNTPGLRSLQSHEPLTRILTSVVNAAQATDRRTKPKVMVKVSPDEKSDSQIQGICDAIWEAGVDGVIVGNTTMRRPDPWPQGFLLTQREAKKMLEQGGYSGPQLFPNTLNLVKKYRKILDQGPKEVDPQPNSAPSSSNTEPHQENNMTTARSTDRADATFAEEMEAGIKRDEARLKPTDTGAADADGDKQPLLRIPERHTSESPLQQESSVTQPPGIDPSKSTSGASPPQTPTESFSQPQKVIFASGGITNGEQALEVLNAGASVAMIYTAMTYGGVGTVGRIKQEMRDRIRPPV